MGEKFLFFIIQEIFFGVILSFIRIKVGKRCCREQKEAAQL